MFTLIFRDENGTIGRQTWCEGCLQVEFELQ